VGCEKSKRTSKLWLNKQRYMRVKTYGADTQSRNLYKSTCTRNLTGHGFLYKIFLVQVSCTEYSTALFHTRNLHARVWLEWWALIGRLPIAAMFSFCCVDVVDNLLYKVNIVRLLSYLLNLFKLFKFPWSGWQKVLRKLFVSSKNARFYFMCRQPKLHELARKFDARNLLKKLVQVSCAIFLTVCHHH